MASVNLSRSGKVDYTTVAGDTFQPGPVAFTIENVAEDFSSATLKMQVLDGETLVQTLTQGSGISVNANALTYFISAGDMSDNLPAGDYNYDVQKTIGTLVSTIQHGMIHVLPQQTI